MLRNYIDKFGTSLTLRIFFITAVILTAACGVTYGFIDWATPITYTSILTDELNDQAQELVRALQNTTIDACEQTITTFEMQTGASVEVFSTDGNVVTPSEFSAKSEDGMDMDIPQKGRASNYDTVIMFNTEMSLKTAITTSYSFSFLNNYNEYMLTVTGNVQTVNQTQAAIRKVLPYLLVVIMLIALLGALVYSRYITKPVVQLSSISQKMSALDFTWKCEEKRKDEIGVLGYNLNTLSQHLSTALSDLQDANHTLRQDIDRDRALEGQRMTFFSAASHELKTPITILKGQLSGMLAGVDVYKDRDKYLARSLKVANRMQSLVQEILTVAQMENAEFVLKHKSVSLTALVTELSKQAADLAEQRNQTLTVTIAPEQNICGDQMLLERAIFNLLANALLHSPEDATIEVCLKSTSTGSLFIIDNSDASISDTALTHLFEAFYRVDASRSRDTGGSGLGLYLVQMILERHKTVCTIENTQNGVRTMVAFQADEH